MSNPLTPCSIPYSPSCSEVSKGSKSRRCIRKREKRKIQKCGKEMTVSDFIRERRLEDILNDGFVT